MAVPCTCTWHLPVQTSVTLVQGRASSAAQRREEDSCFLPLKSLKSLRRLLSRLTGLQSAVPRSYIAPAHTPRLLRYSLWDEQSCCISPV